MFFFLYFPSTLTSSISTKFPLSSSFPPHGRALSQRVIVNFFLEPSVSIEQFKGETHSSLVGSFHRFMEGRFDRGPADDEGERRAHVHGGLGLIYMDGGACQYRREPIAKRAVLDIVLAHAHLASNLDGEGHVVVWSYPGGVNSEYESCSESASSLCLFKIAARAQVSLDLCAGV